MTGGPRRAPRAARVGALGLLVAFVAASGPAWAQDPDAYRIPLETLLEAPDDSPPLGAPPPASVAEHLRDAAAWCDGQAVLLPRDLVWCDAVPPGCAAMQERCDAWKAEEASPPWWQGLGCDQAPDLAVPLPDLSDLPRLLGIGAIAVAAGLLARALVLWVRALRAAPVAPPAVAIDAPAAPSPPPFDLAGDLLSQARAAIDRGDAATALTILRFAALTALHRTGRVTLHPSRTDREYVRSLRADPDAAGELRAVVGAVERQRYAGAALGRADLEAAFDAAGRLLRRLGGAVALLLLALLPARAPHAEPAAPEPAEPAEERGMDAEQAEQAERAGDDEEGIFPDLGELLDRPRSTAPGDDALLAPLLEASGYDVTEVLLTGGRGLRPCGAGLVLVEAETELDAAARAQIEAVLDCGGIVVVVGSGAPSAAGEGAAGEGAAGEGAAGEVVDGAVIPSPVISAAGPLRTPWPAVVVPHEPGAQVYARAGDRVVAGLDDTQSAGLLVLVGVPDLLTDAALLHPENSAFVLGVVRSLSAGPIIVARVPSTGAAQNPLDPFLAAGLLPALIHGLVAFLLAAWAYGRRFAAPRLGAVAVRRDFTEHLRAAGRLYREAGASRQALGAYARWALLRLRARTRATEGQLDTTVAARTGRSLADVQRLLAEARDAAARPHAAPAPPDTRGPLTIGRGPAHDLALQEELWQILAPPRRPPGSHPPPERP